MRGQPPAKSRTFKGAHNRSLMLELLHPLLTASETSYDIGASGFFFIYCQVKPRDLGFRQCGHLIALMERAIAFVSDETMRLVSEG